VVTEIVEPGIGLAASREFLPTEAAVVEWCEKRVGYHRGAIILAEYKGEQQRERLKEREFAPEYCETMRGRLSALIHGLFSKTQAEAAE
jgi:hypothetical protein